MPYINGVYYSDREVEAAKKLAASKGSSDTDKFLASAAIGAVTGSSVVGALIGGSLLGGLLGDAVEGTDDSWL